MGMDSEQLGVGGEEQSQENARGLRFCHSQAEQPD